VFSWAARSRTRPFRCSPGRSDQAFAERQSHFRIAAVNPCHSPYRGGKKRLRAIHRTNGTPPMLRPPTVASHLPVGVNDSTASLTSEAVRQAAS
jgi:hypothetical protein